jgi:hypothetical protein
MLYKSNTTEINNISANVDEVLEEVIEIEEHLHNYEKWFGAANVPVGETHVADRMAGGVSPFQLIAGNDTFGQWVQVLGSADTPVQAGKIKFDLHRLMVTSTNSTSPFNIQIITGESSGINAKLAIEDFDEVPYISATNNNDSGISDIIDKRVDAGTKVWMRTCCIGQDGPNINFYIGLHEYEYDE